MVLLGVFAGASLLGARPARAQASVSISFFYDELSPYGRWESVGRWGDCWIPGHVAAGWQPYTDGQWIYTDYGWTWVSEDPWGGDPYHYGTWVWEDPWGWVWVPGTVWAPAWVTWCYSDTYVGWAPIPPTLSISYSGYSGAPIIVPQARYVFVPVNRFAGVRVSSVRLPVAENAAIFPRVRKLTSYSVSRGVIVNRGPSITTIERAARVRIPRAPISEAKSRPAPISASGSPRGKRVAVVAPAPVRAREIASRRGGSGTSGSPRGSAAAPGHEAKPAPAPHGHEGKSSSSRESTPSHRTAPPAHREAPPPRHEAAPPKHEAPPPRHEAAPPRHEAPPPRREAPPPNGAPPTREAPPAHREAPSPHGASAEHRAVPPHKKEPPPPPPPERREKPGNAAPPGAF
ncbi:MAG TPA: DUF6600 domain-containing protein [Thermoanaerobaculia bacterium]|nr:DUF6600 domain-containing protein [Thermoanaerobaculia bacterium]